MVPFAVSISGFQDSRFPVIDSVWESEILVGAEHFGEWQKCNQVEPFGPALLHQEAIRLRRILINNCVAESDDAKKSAGSISSSSMTTGVLSKSTKSTRA